MRTLANPGRFIRIADDPYVVQAERISPIKVQLEVSDPAVTAVAAMGEDVGRALLDGLAELYGCRVVETGL